MARIVVVRGMIGVEHERESRWPWVEEGWNWEKEKERERGFCQAELNGSGGDVAGGGGITADKREVQVDVNVKRGDDDNRERYGGFLGT